MAKCDTCGRPHVTLGVNAVYKNPANWNDKRLECDDCAGIVRDERGRIVHQRIYEQVKTRERVQ